MNGQVLFDAVMCVPILLLMSTAVVLLLGLAASLLPAWRAARYNPIEALNKT